MNITYDVSSWSDDELGFSMFNIELHTLSSFSNESDCTVTLKLFLFRQEIFKQEDVIYLSLVVSVSLMKNSCHFSRNSSLYILKQIDATNKSFTEMFSCLWVYGYSPVRTKEECYGWRLSFKLSFKFTVKVDHVTVNIGARLKVGTQVLVLAVRI